MTRMSIDVSKELHQMIKIHAMFDHKTIRDFVVSAIEGAINKKHKTQEVNAETRKVLLESEAGIGLTRYNNMDEFFKEIGC